MAKKKAQTKPRKLTKAGKPAKKTGRKPIVPKNTPKRRASITKFKEDVDSGKIVIKPNPFLFGLRGAPPTYSDPAAMADRIEQYFEYIQGEIEIVKTKVPSANQKGYVEVEEEKVIRKPEPPTVTGLCLFLGFSSRSSLVDYKKDSKEFAHIISQALAHVAHGYELNLHGAKCFGSMFALGNINSKDWKHKQDITGSFSDETLEAIRSFNYITPPEPGKPQTPDPREETQDFLK